MKIQTFPQKGCFLFINFFLLLTMLRAGDPEQAQEAAPSAAQKGPVAAWMTAAVEAAAKGNVAKADSLAMLAIAEAEMSYDETLILESLITLFSLPPSDERTHSLSHHLDRLESLTRKRPGDVLKWQGLHKLSAYYQSRFEFEKALDYAYQALALSDQLSDKRLKANSLLSVGRCLEDKKSKLDAFRYYASALATARMLREEPLLLDVYQAFSRFYNFQRMYDKAVEYKLMELHLLQQLPHDSLAIMQVYYDLEGISLHSRGSLNLESLKRIIRFAERKHQPGLRDQSLALIRTYLINTDDVATLYRFYNVDFPEYLSLLEKESPLTYIRLKAIFSEFEGDFTQAEMYYSEAEKEMRQHPNLILQSHFFLRLAEFMSRQDRLEDAINNAGLALSLAERASWPDYALRATKLLEVLSLRQADYQAAWKYAVRTRGLSDSIQALARSEDLLMIELENAERMEAMEAARKAEEIKRRNNIQYTAIIIAIFSLFVLLILLGSVRVPKWSIQALGFFAFIFLFEFIILVADYEIHHLTHGVPWKMLGIKVVLIAFLLPFHHWVEKKVVQYLLRKKLIRLSGFSFKRIFQNIWQTVFGH
jgi:tetratricopeptide (TPR) repeat protein